MKSLPMVFWLAQGETTDAGVLETSFTLPDSVTSYRIVAVAADSADNFALAERSVTASKPLQLVSSMPRFLTGGDRMEARFLVQNLSARDGEILVEASAKGAVLERQSASLSVKAGASGLVAFPLQTRDPGSLSLTVRATMNGEGDAARFTLPVLPPAPLTVVAASGMVGEGAKKSLPVKLPEQLDPRSNLDLIIAPSPAAGMTLAAKQVLEYPWDCLEQRFSRAWARALRLEHGDMLGLPADPEDRGQIVEVLEAAARFQKSDGGFALWPGLPESNFYLTTYVLFVSSQMKDLELGLDRDVADRAYGYLMETLEAAQDNAAQDGKQRATAVRTGGLDAEALALGVLAGREQYQARAETLFQVLQEKSRAGKRQANPMRWSGLILAAHQLPGLPDRQKHLDRLTVALNNSVEITPTQAHFRSPSSESLWGTLGSTLRDNGLALAALSLARPDYPRLDAVASWVSQGLGDTPVLSTQEGAFGLWGLSRYLKSLGGDGTAEARATWDSQTINARFTRLTQPPVVWNLPADALAEGKSSELVVSAIKGKPCWTARLAYGHPDDLGQDLNAGFTLSREVDTPSPWRMGDEVTVTLTLTVPATRRHVLLFAPFPAGLEPLYASRTDLAAEKREYQHPWRYQDEYDDGLLLYAANVAPGVYTYTYILRAAAPGSFVHRSARVEEMYTPEVAGRCAGERVEVLGE